MKRHTKQGITLNTYFLSSMGDADGHFVTVFTKIQKEFKYIFLILLQCILMKFILYV